MVYKTLAETKQKVDNIINQMTMEELEKLLEKAKQIERIKEIKGE